MSQQMSLQMIKTRIWGFFIYFGVILIRFSEELKMFFQKRLFHTGISRRGMLTLK